MSYKRFFNVVYDDRGRRHWQPSGEDKPSSPTQPEKKLEIPVDYSKALEARQGPSLNQAKLGKVKIDKTKQDFDKNLGYTCKLCQVSVKDNLSWLDHLNSPEHNRKIGNHMKVEKITADTVEEHLKTLRSKRRKAPPSLQEIMKKIDEGDPSKRAKVNYD